MTEAPSAAASFTAEDCVRFARLISPTDDTARILGLASRIHEATTRWPPMTSVQLSRFGAELQGCPGRVS